MPSIEIRPAGIPAIVSILPSENWLLRQYTLIERVVLFLGAMGLIIPGFWTDLMGLGAVSAVYIWQKRSLAYCQRAKRHVDEGAGN